MESKKQRNPKNQRDRGRISEKGVESSNDLKQLKSEPQPQRANRRQRNEQPLQNKDTPEILPETKEKKEPVENIVVDFSNLKRETEEIAKLTKKFTKREISSNWHRYSVVKDGENTLKSEEEEPADFSDLIQVPASKGGHLQLKDEQDWSSATGSELSGYFALDLKQLSQNLACIPLYELLRLPKHLFTEEVLRQHDILAHQAKNVYSQDKTEDPNSKVLKTLTNLIQRKDEPEEDMLLNGNSNPSSGTSNLLDVETITEKLLKTSVVPEMCADVSSVVDLNNITNNNVLDKVIKDEKDIKEPVANEESHVKSDSKEVVVESGGFMKNSSILKSTHETTPERLLVSDSCHDDSKFKKDYENVNESLLPDKEVLNTNINFTKKISPSKEETPLSTKSEIIHQGDQIKIINESKEKRTRQKNLSTTKANENLSKSLDKIRDIKFEDDDDLDYLLSLKKPIESHTKTQNKPQPLKGAKTTDVSTEDKTSELDDWLDSMLDD